MNVPNFRERAEEILDQQTVDHEKKVKLRMIPLLLGPYDPNSLSEMEDVKTTLKEAGYNNSIMLRDIQTKAAFEGKLDLKFSHTINSFQDSDYFVIPLFYFPKQNEIRMGHHAELVETSLNADLLILLSSGLFYQEEANMIHHKRMFLHQTPVGCFDEYKEAAIKHVTKFFPLLEKKMTIPDKRKLFIGKKYDKKKR